MRVAGAWRGFMDLVDLMDLMDNVGGAMGYPVGLQGAGWWDAGADLSQGYARQLDGNGGVRNCGGVALVSDLSDKSDKSDKMGAPLYTPWVCCTAIYGSEARCAVGVIIAIGAPITQSHNSHNSHNSHIKRRPTRHCK